MAKNIRKFVNREFARTVELDLLRRLLEPYRSKLNFDVATLPNDEKSRRETLFEFFRMADETFPSEFQDALHCIMVLANQNGLRILQEQADRVGVRLIPEQEIRGEDDGRHLTPRHVALRAYLDHRALFDRLDLHAFIAPPSPMEFVGAREGIESRHEDPDARTAFSRAAVQYFADAISLDDDTDPMVRSGSSSSTRSPISPARRWPGRKPARKHSVRRPASPTPAAPSACSPARSSRS